MSRLRKRTVVAVILLLVGGSALLCFLNLDQHSTPRLIERLADPDESVSSTAQQELVSLGQVAVPELLLASEDPRPEVRGRVAQALGLIHPASPKVVERLAGLLMDPDFRVRWRATSGLAAAAPEAATAIPQLETLVLNSSEAQAVRIGALRALAAMGPQALHAAPAIASCLENSSLGLAAADAIASIGPAARDALPRLREVEALAQHNESVLTAVRAAISALSQPDK